jgi:hypothetical protein
MGQGPDAVAADVVPFDVVVVVVLVVVVVVVPDNAAEPDTHKICRKTGMQQL